MIYQNIEYQQINQQTNGIQKLEMTTINVEKNITAIN